MPPHPAPVASICRPGYARGMRRRWRNQFSPLVPLILLAALPAYAQAANKSVSRSTATQLGTVASWTAYTYKEKSGRVCFLAGDPQRREPATAKRKPSMAMVTHRPQEKIANVVSFAEGYPLKEGSEASVDIGGTTFNLFTKGDSAWARTAELDKAIVETMAKGKQAVVKALPEKGPPTTDTYSLAGFAQALALIDKACEIKR
jgi:Invasion associated locus B (IalB) protein